MSKGLKFFKCGVCGNIAELINDSGVRMVCCDQNMTLLVSNTVEATIEKHIPFVTRPKGCPFTCNDGQKCNCDCDCAVRVQIGSEIHPMIQEHHIEWIVLETENGLKRRMLNVGDEPVALFCTCDDKAVAAYAYCNLHGLWKSDI